MREKQPSAGGRGSSEKEQPYVLDVRESSVGLVVLPSYGCAAVHADALLHGQATLGRGGRQLRARVPREGGGADGATQHRGLTAMRLSPPPSPSLPVYPLWASNRLLSRSPLCRPVSLSPHWGHGGGWWWFLTTAMLSPRDHGISGCRTAETGCSWQLEPGPRMLPRTPPPPP